MQIAIVDDEAPVRETLEGYIIRYAEESGTAFSISQFASGDALLEKYEPVYDILIFDIDMPGTNGLDTARLIRRTDERVIILFITNIAQYAINGYEVDAVDYIIKPIGYYDFALKFAKALRRVERQDPEVLFLDTTKGQVAVPVPDLLYVEAKGHYMAYRTADTEYLVRGSITEHEEILRRHHFERVQRSYLVNLARIENIRTGEIIVGGFSVPSSKIYRDSLMQAYMRYIKR